MFSPADIKAVIFDYGATLDTGGDHWVHVFLDAWKLAGVALAFDSFREAYIAGERALAPTPDGSRIVERDCTFRRLLGMKTREQARLLADAGVLPPDSAPLLADMVANLCYSTARRQTARSAQILRRLAGKYQLAVASNFYGNLDTVLDEFGLLPFFCATVDSAVAGVRKPDPAIFALACHSLGMKPEDTLVVGDSPAKDILPAASLGCRTALVAGRRWPGAPSAVCSPDMRGSLEDIAETLLA